MRPEGVLEVALYATDLKAVESFYTEVLGLAVQEKTEGRHVFFRCGYVMILVFNPDVTSKTGGVVPPHGTIGAGHMAFSIKSGDFEHWREHLSKHNVAIEKDVDWGQGGHSVYFRDPAGNSIELTTPKTWGIE